MTVYLLVHTDHRGWEPRSKVLAVYASLIDANNARITRTPAGRRSTAWGAHNEDCCQVLEMDLIEPEPVPSLHGLLA